MAGSGRRIVVEFIGDASSLKSNAASGEKALQGFSGKAQAAGRIAGKALAGGLLLAGAAAVKATAAAAEDEAAQSQLAQQLRQAAGASDKQIASTEDWITKQGQATGITDDELRPALARLATATGDVGEAQKLAALAMDVSAGSGKSYQQVTEALAKAQNGNIGALGRLGIATKDADGKTKSLSQITQDLADKYNGAAAKAAETTAGKQKILTTQMGELQEQIGAKLLPAMVKLAEIGVKTVGWISENARVVGISVAAFGALLGATWAIGTAMGIYAVVTGEATAVTLLQKAAVGAVAAAQLIWSGVTKAITAAQWLLNAALSANPIGLVVVAIAALVAGLILAYKHSETFRNIVNAAFGAIKNVVLAVVGWFGKYVPEVFGAVKSAIGSILSAMKSVIGNVWDTIVGAVRAVLGVYRSVIVAAFNGIRDFLGNVVDGWKRIFSAAWDAIKEGFQRAKDALSSVAGNIRDAVGGAFGAIKDTIQSVIDKVEWLIDKIGDLIGKIKSIPHPDIPGLKVGIPGLAKGGVVNKPTLALIGEDGPEAVVPLGKKNAPGGSIPGMGGGGGVANIYLQSLDPRGAGKAVVDALREYERQTGRQYVVSPA